MGTMIKDVTAQRIMGDAEIAIDALEAVKEVILWDNQIHTDYLKEKTDTVKRCLKFFDCYLED